ncbi:MAG: CocE/NonD family hydrolase [Coprothermobacterota bacterium]|nr:CocE/NonD family hydrolase [Coprothermobacterota bacterium]
MEIPPQRRGLFLYGLLIGLALLVSGCASPSLPSPENSPAPLLPVYQRYNLRAPMRDGAELWADAWAPIPIGSYPTILIRTCYGKRQEEMKYDQLGTYFAARGYVFLVQDVRGCGDSDGIFNFLFQEEADGYDTVEWVAQQSWSNGRVGMMGASYLGAAQWLAARARPPHLVCVAPTAACGRYLEELPAVGGVFYQGWALPWLLDVLNLNKASSVNAQAWEEIFRHRPLLEADEMAVGERVPLYREFLQHPTLDDYWKRIQFTAEDFGKIEIPVLNTTGWFDADQPGALFYWRGMEAAYPGRTDQFLTIGPWTHEQTFGARLGQVNLLQFTADTTEDAKEMHLAFFERYLKGTGESLSLPHARVYLTGLNQWRDLAQYPPADAQPVSFFLHSGGAANSLQGDGTLSLELPGVEPSDHFTFSPTMPVPIDASGWAGNCRLVESRQDVLVYTSSPLEQPLTVLGTVQVELWAATDGRDTDFVARLVDVDPQGIAFNLGCEQFGGAIRARFRSGLEQEVLLEPGALERYTIDLFDIGHVFLPGHCLRLEVTSSAFPILHPNPNTGNPIATDTEQRSAEQTIVHERSYPSALRLMVLP